MNGIILTGGDDATIEGRAKSRGLPLVKVANISQVELVWDKTLIAEAGTQLPWDLLPAAWNFLDRWDAAVPLWRYGVLAKDVGTAEERSETETVVRDLRVLLHSVELLFVRRNELGRALLVALQLELVSSQEPRLAFLRALYRMKPRLCVLPRSWLAQVQQWNGAPAPGKTRVRGRMTGRPMVVVEVAPGQMVKCYAGDEAKVMASFGGTATKPRRSDVMAVVSSKSFTMDNQKARANKGKLVRVELAPGQFVKMYRRDAIEGGHIKPEAQPAEKARPPEGNKMQPPEGDKGKPASSPGPEPAEPEAPAAATADELSKYIPGVGLATERLLNSHGIMTFAQLRAAEDLSFLGQKQQDDIKAWRDG